MVCQASVAQVVHKEMDAAYARGAAITEAEKEAVTDELLKANMRLCVSKDPPSVEAMEEIVRKDLEEMLGRFKTPVPSTRAPSTRAPAPGSGVIIHCKNGSTVHCAAGTRDCRDNSARYCSASKYWGVVDGRCAALETPGQAAGVAVKYTSLQACQQARGTAPPGRTPAPATTGPVPPECAAVAERQRLICDQDTRAQLEKAGAEGKEELAKEIEEAEAKHKKDLEQEMERSSNLLKYTNSLNDQLNSYKHTLVNLRYENQNTV